MLAAGQTVEEEQSMFSSGCEDVNGRYVCVSQSSSNTVDGTADTSCTVMVSNQECSTCVPCVASDGRYGVTTDCDNVDAQYTASECVVYVDFSGGSFRYAGGWAMALLVSSIATVVYL